MLTTVYDKWQTRISNALSASIIRKRPAKSMLRAWVPIRRRRLIIAATALETGRVLVTGNTAHYAWISGLTLEDWRNQ